MKIKNIILFLLLIWLVPLKLKCQHKYSLNIVYPKSVKGPQINYVSVDRSDKNLIKWQQEPNANITSFKIYRNETDSNQGWILIRKMNYPDNFQYEDLTSFPKLKSYRYLISTVNKCGEEIYSKSAHRTIELTREIHEKTIILKWNPYEGFDVDKYNIYKGTKQDSMNLLCSITNDINFITDNLISTNNIYYQVEAVEKSDSNQSFTSLSNIVSSQFEVGFSDTLITEKINLFPNPIKFTALVCFPYYEKINSKYTIFNLNGQAIRNGLIYSNPFEITRNKLVEGIYILEIYGNKTYRKKFQVTNR